MARCQGVSVLATSREPLRISGEQVYRVPSLALPPDGVDDPELVAASDAVRLFAARAAGQRPGFSVDQGNAALLVRVCRRLDGIALAIELAAVRLRSLSLAELDARLDDRLSLLRVGSRTAPARQQTLRALIDWSYELLPAPERLALACLSVFAAAGCDLPGAEAVCSEAGIASAEVIDLVDSLVDKSLLTAEDRSGTVRYRLLETVHEYAAQRLAENGTAVISAAQRAHRDHYVALAETTGPLLFGPGRREALESFTIDYENLRTALELSLQWGDPEPGLRLAGAAANFWRARGHGAEAAELIGALLAHPAAQKPTRARALALGVHADVSEETGQYATAVADATEMLTIVRDQAYRDLEAKALLRLAWPECRLGEHERAVGHCEVGIALAIELGDWRTLSFLHAGRGAALDGLGHDPQPDFERALTYARRSASPEAVSTAMFNLAYHALSQSRPDEARGGLEEALAASRAQGDVPADEAGCAIALAVAHRQLPFSPTAKAALTSAHRFGMGEPGTEHILIVLTARGEGAGLAPSRRPGQGR